MITIIGDQWINVMGKEIKGSSNLFIPTSVPLHQRSTVLIGSELNVFQKFYSHKKECENELITYSKKAFRMFNTLKGNSSASTILEEFNFPNALNIEEASKDFTFPPGHPVDGMAYSCSSLEPKLYIPLSSFHDYIFQAKMSSFLDMCSCLNAKVAKVSHVEEDGKEVTSELKVEKVPTQSGIIDGELSSTFKSRVLNGMRIDYTFPKPNHDLIEFKSPWLLEEPSWRTLNNVRFHRDVKSFQVELNHNNDFGVEAKVVAMFNKVGAKIGGSYSAFKKRRLVYDVEFWPKDSLKLES